MPSRLQPLSFVISLLVSGYLLFFLVPSQIQGRYQALIAPPESPQKTELALAPISLSPALSDRIQIKASGEDPNQPNSDLSGWGAGQKEFEERFGSQVENFSQTGEKIHYPFKVTDDLRETVDFWIAIFGRYEKDQYIFHHKDDVALVYSAIDLSELGAEQESLNPEEWAREKNFLIEEEKVRIKKLLQRLKVKLSEKALLTPEEQRLAHLFAKENHISLSKAAALEAIRVQEGYAHRFKQAIALSGLYMDQMEAIFSSKGLPVELTRIPFVESAFNIKAVSSAEAKGLWQFIQPTGKRYLKIDSFIDERYDPILSTYAAAEHLKNEYQLLGSWPLTVNAYNTGPGRLLKAKKDLNTEDIGIIIKKFEDPGYQFFSRNYYPEFLAALQVYDHQEIYFGQIIKMAPLQYDLFFPTEEVNLKTLAESLDIPLDMMRQLNPALASSVLEGKTPISRGYMVRVPDKLGGLFTKASLEARKQVERARLHIVEQGETVASVAGLYDVSEEKLKEVNQLLPQEELKSGMVLKIPQSQGVAMTQEEEKTF